MTQEQDSGLHAEPDSTRSDTHAGGHSSKTTLIRSLGVVISLVAVIVCSWLLYSLFKDTIEVPVIDELEQIVSGQPAATPLDPPKPSSEQASTAEEDAQPAINQPPPPPLPNLNNSDEEIQQAARKLTPALKWADWITTEEAIRKFVVVVDNMAQGKIARKYLPIPKPEQKFVKHSDGVKVYLDPAGYERYTPYVSLFEGVDNEMAVALYQRYLPLMEQAFAELGYPDQRFHDTLMSSFDLILTAPVIEEDIELVRPSVLYKFAYPALENAPALHKQLIRMGPENTRRLQQKIEQLKAALSAAKQS